MNEIKSYIYTRMNSSDEIENWEISLCRVKYNEFLGMALERESNLRIGWRKLNVDTENTGFLEMVKIINHEVKQLNIKDCMEKDLLSPLVSVPHTM